VVDGVNDGETEGVHSEMGVDLRLASGIEIPVCLTDKPIEMG